jgi:small-conductance mechanosensitive channel
VTNDPLFSELRSRRSKASGAERERLQAELDEALAGFKKGTAMAYEVARAKLQALETELTRTEKHADLPEETVQRRTKAERALNIQRSILDALRARVAQESIELEVLRPTVTIVEKARIVR